ncbi:MAG: cytochrome c3 family protein [Cyanobacteria bacterium]|nr:cytochrome c3 family protein [Cyanobacteriota bacterium]
MTRRFVLAVVVLGVGLGIVLALRSGAVIDIPLMQRQVSPGALSSAHASMDRNCAACHTPLRSADATRCVACHANNTSLLQRQPTAFHATIGTCSPCHSEHRGPTVRPVAMDHTGLASAGLDVARGNIDNASNRRLLEWLRAHESLGDVTHPKLTAAETVLNCATCHSTKDRHQKRFGDDCAVCHATASWAIPEFVHPSPRSTDCVQCHQAPPSHYMEHFKMVSQAVARAPDANAEQCFKCHQTTAWNDIKGVGWYKHH